MGHSARLEHEAAFDALRVGQLEDEARLADPGFADEADDLRFAGLSARQPLEQCVEVARAAHEAAQRPSADLESWPLASHDASQGAGATADGFHREVAFEEARGSGVHDDLIRPRLLEEGAHDVRGPTAGMGVHPGDGAGAGDQVRADMDREAAVPVALESAERLEHGVRGQHSPARRVLHGVDPEHGHQLRWRELFDPGAEAHELLDQLRHHRRRLERAAFR